MDMAIIWTIVGTGATGIGLIYAFLRNFKNDINYKIVGWIDLTIRWISLTTISR